MDNEDEILNDPGLKTILNCLSDFCDYTDFSDEFDICKDIILQIESNDNLHKVDVYKLMSSEMFSNLLNCLCDFRDYSHFEDEMIACHQVEERLKHYEFKKALAEPVSHN